MSFREVTEHQTHPDEPIRIFVAGPVNHAGVQNSYVAGVLQDEVLANCLGTINFQNGHPDEVGYNGVTIETLLAMCYDRLACFQAGPMACNHNAEAIQFIELALESLKDRTRERKIESTKERITQRSVPNG